MPAHGGNALTQRLLALWACVRMPVELLVCVISLLLIGAAESLGHAFTGLLTTLKWTFLVWVAFNMLELHQQWKGGSKPLRSTVGEIYRGYRTGDPAFKRSTASDLLGFLAGLLALIALTMSQVNG